ncbi:MAG: glycosyltransferase [Afipia felis]|nr:glycosyltransferase [Afipia felis]
MSTIAAIIPLYNGATYIEAAIKSVLGQERPADEIIVVDDGSTDNGSSIVEAMAIEHPAIRLLRKENGGQGAARNYGVMHCGSDLIALLDQDDYWYGDHLKELERAFIDAGDSRLAYVYSNLDRIDLDGMMIHHDYLDYFRAVEHPKKTLVDCLKGNMYILPSASLISKSAFESVSGFDDRLRGYEDDDLFLRFFCAGFKSAYVDKSLSAWRIHSGSTSASIKMLISAQIYYDKLVETFKNKNETRKNLVADIIAPRFALAGHRAFKDYVRGDNPRDAKFALRFALKCMRSMRLAGRVRMLTRIGKYAGSFYLRQLFRGSDARHS